MVLKMLINKKIKLPFIIIFLLCQLVLWYLTLIVGGETGNTASFSIVALSFLFSLLFIDFKQLKLITQIALFFTVIADIFLLLVSPRTVVHQSIAMTSFTIVQLSYLIRLLKEQESKKINKINLILRLPLTTIIIIATCIVLKDGVNYLAIISVIYYANLILNVVFGFVNFKKSPLLAIGLLAFLLCDTVVGFVEMNRSFITVSEGNLLYALIHADFNFAWLFYAPSQVMLSISAETQPSLKK